VTVAPWFPQYTPAGFVNAMDHGAAGDGVADDGPALEAIAAEHCIPYERGLWLPGGCTFRIASRAAFIGAATNEPAFTIAGVRGASRVLCDCPGVDAFLFSAFISLRISGLMFFGKVGRFGDCLSAIDIVGCLTVEIDHCNFKWLGSTGTACIYQHGGSLYMHDCVFGGVGCNSAAGAVVRTQLYARAVYERLSFSDLAYMDGTTTGAKIGAGGNQCFPSAWIKAEDVVKLSGGFSQSTFAVRDCWFDENAKRSVWCAPTVNLGAVPPRHRLYAAELSDVRASAGYQPTFDAVPVFDFANVDRLDVQRTFCAELHDGGAQQRDALKLTSVTRTHLDGFRCATIATDANRIVTDADCAALIMSGMAQGTDYRTLSADNATTVTEYA
jgi:hypothetical protein